MTKASQYEIYRSVIRSVLEDKEHLPSLPAITLKIRRAIDDDNTTIDKLSELISMDPALSALLMKCAASPLYRTVNKPTTIQGVISLMGMPAVGNLVMTHSLKSLFPIGSVQLRKLFNITWKRQITKASTAAILARKLRFQPPEEALIASLLTEVGTLAVLSAFSHSDDIPDEDTYFALCRDYSKSLGSILLTKWNIEPRLTDAVKHCGDWQYSTPGAVALVDIINLSLYQTVLRTQSSPNLPLWEDLAAFRKLLPPFNALDRNGELLLISEYDDEIESLSSSFG